MVRVKLVLVNLNPINDTYIHDMQTVKYLNLVGDEEDIGNERFKWSRASTFSYNRNAIGLAVAYASAIRTHLSVHVTAHP